MFFNASLASCINGPFFVQEMQIAEINLLTFLLPRNCKIRLRSHISSLKLLCLECFEVNWTMGEPSL